MLLCPLPPHQAAAAAAAAFGRRLVHAACSAGLWGGMKEDAWGVRLWTLEPERHARVTPLARFFFLLESGLDTHTPND